MAINQNHAFEDIDGVRCAVIEKNCSAARVDFLKALLEFNGYTVLTLPTPAPKPAAPAVKKEGDNEIASVEVPVATPPATFTVYVTQNEFNVTNAIFGRLLRTTDGHIVTMKYWKQQEEISNDGKPYFAKQWR
jgi:hypothetical protein